MKLKLADLATFKSFAHKAFLEIPNRAKFSGMVRGFTETEVMQLAWIKGTIDLLAQMGVDTSKITIEFDNSEQGSVHE